MKNLVPIFLILAVGAVAFWYLGHYRPTQKMLKTGPEKVYKTTTPIAAKPSTPNPETATHTFTQASENAAGIESTNITESTETVDSSIKSTDTSTTPTDTTAPHESPQDMPAPSEHEESEDVSDAANEMSKQLMDAADAILEEAASLQKYADTVLANQLKEMSVEKQVETLSEMRKAVINARNPSTQEPLFDTHQEAEDAWQNMLDGIIEAGYTPPNRF